MEQNILAFIPFMINSNFDSPIHLYFFAIKFKLFSSYSIVLYFFVLCFFLLFYCSYFIVLYFLFFVSLLFIFLNSFYIFRQSQYYFINVMSSPNHFSAISFTLPSAFNSDNAPDIALAKA